MRRRNHIAFGLVLLLLEGCGGGSSPSPPPPPPPPPALTISGLAPQAQMIDTPHSIGVLGSSFSQSATILFDGQPLRTTFVDSSFLVGDYPPGFTFVQGVHQITVVESGVGTSNALDFEFYQPGIGQGAFRALRSYLGGRDIRFIDVAAGDFNQDGIDDVVAVGGTSSSGTEKLFLFQGRTDSTLDFPVKFDFTGENVKAIGVGDFNMDALDDVVILNGSQVAGRDSNANYSVLMGDGQGSFVQVSDGVLTGPTQVLDMKLADVTGDSRPDLVIRAKDPTANGELWLVPGKSGSTFADPQLILRSQAFINAFRVVDVNDDQKLDLIFDGPDQIRFLVNQGGGAFSVLIPPAFSGHNGMITGGDLNSDGKMDLLLQPLPTVLGGTAQIFLGLGGGDFTALPEFRIAPAGFAPYPFVTGDFDDDGNLDFAGVNFATQPSHILILWGEGDGNLTPETVNGPYSFHITRGDFNGDGIDDVATANRSTHVTTLFGGNRNPESPDVHFLDVAAGSLSTADTNGDSLPELLTTKLPFASGHAQYLVNLGGGSFSSPVDAPLNAARLAELNGDNYAEIIGFLGNDLLIYENDGGGNILSPPLVFETNAPFIKQIAVADLDEDGFVDIVGSGFILYGKGGLQFDLQAIPIGSPVLVGDYDGDGVLDLALPDGARMLFGEGNRSYREVRSEIPTPTSASYAVADFNSDGKDDLAISGNETIFVEASVGDGTFRRFAVLGMGSRTVEIGAGDFDGNGLPDIVAGLKSSQEIVLFGNIGNGKFDRAFFASGANSIALVVTDFDRDGWPDIAYSNFNLSFRPPNLLVMFNK